jgi:hypothetical protein
MNQKPKTKPLFTISSQTNSHKSQTTMTTTNFTQFYDSWYSQFNNLIHQLTISSTQTENSEELILKVMSHYEDYYKAKSTAVEKDPLHVLSSPWATSLERSLHWIAGWRPTTAFHLIYTESSLLFESHIVDILRGFTTGDLGDLSPNQFRRVSDLQCDTVSNSIFILFYFYNISNSISYAFNFIYILILLFLFVYKYFSNTLE